MRVYFAFEPKEHFKESLVTQFPNVQFVFTKVLDESELRQADVLVTYGVDLTDKHIDIAEQLQWIFVASAGIESMPNEAIAKKGIVVSNARGIHKYPMAESILAHILAQKRALPWMYANQAKGEWNKKGPLTELRDSTAIIIGPGAIGSEVGRLLQAFGVKTIGCNLSGKTAPYMNAMVSFNELIASLPQADIVLAILPDTPATNQLITYQHFEVMKNSAIFMNFGRGNLVATDVLVTAMQQRLIGHTVLDVFEEEPLPAGHPLWELNNVTISPHVSSFSSRYVERALDIFKPSLVKWMNGDRDIENKMDVLRGY